MKRVISPSTFTELNMRTSHRSPRSIGQLSARGVQLLAIILAAVAISYLAMLVFFQFVYPHFVRGAIEGMLQSLYGAADLDASADTRFAQGFMFLNGALLSLTGTIIVSAAAYFIVTRAQEKATETALDIERLRLLHELESEIESIQSTNAVRLEGVAGFSNDVPYPFNVALTRAFTWSFDDAVGRRTRFIAGVGRMEMFLAGNESLITTDILHRALHWYRRIDRGRELGLVTDHDLYLMWRYILTFATDGRFQFIDHYFGGTGRSGSEDTDAIRRTLVDLIVYAFTEQKSAVLDYLRNRVDPSLLAEASRRSGRDDMEAMLRPGIMTAARSGPVGKQPTAS
jgi:hypothetical protein